MAAHFLNAKSGLNKLTGQTLWLCRDRSLALGTKPVIMGVLNLTPDSFSDGGKYALPADAVAQGLLMEQEGADILDLGGESSRPGSRPIAADQERDRVMPVLEELAQKTKCLLAIDTTKSSVAEAALSAGAHIVNDVSGMTDDPAMPETARRFRAGVILAHRRGISATMQENPSYDDVVLEVADWLKKRASQLADRGLDSRSIAVDPGIGFGKTTRHNLQLLANLSVLDVPYPVVIGLSRKRFLGEITGRDNPMERLAATVAALTWTVLAGAEILRVHDVGAAHDAVAVTQALLKEHTG